MIIFEIYNIISVLFLVRLTQSYEIKTSTTSLSKKTGEQAFFYCELTLADEDEDTIDNLKSSWNGFTRNDVKDDRQQLKTYAKTKSIKERLIFRKFENHDCYGNRKDWKKIL